MKRFYHNQNLFSLIYDNLTLVFICYNTRNFKVINMKRFVYSLMLCSALFATNYEDGMNAYKNKNYEKAMELFSKAAKEDKDVKSIRNIGIMYASGMGVKQDFVKAVELLKKASNEGDAYAGFSLGNMYSMGDGVDKNFKEAAFWYEKSANAGNAQSSYNLGYLYTYGDGVKKNPTTAFQWYEKSANAGNIDAQINLSFIYISGQGVKKDMTKAAFWAKKVLDTGDERIKQIWEQFELEKYLNKK